MHKSNGNKGGKRPGSGRPKKEETKTINFRVPTNKADYLKPLVSIYIKTLLNGNDAKPEPAQQSEAVKPNPPAQKSVSKEPTMAELLRQSSILK